MVHTVLSGETEKTLDPPLEIPETLPAVTVASSQERWTETPTYSHLLTNIPAFAMSFSDSPLDKAFKDTGAPQPRPWVASETRDPAEMATDYKNYFGPYTAVQNYLEDYFKSGRADDIQLGVTVEDVAKDEATGKWRLVLRRPVVGRKGEALNQWWEEKFDGVVVANGRYYIPNIPEVPGLANFQKAFPGVVEHSKFYRTPEPYTGLV